MNANESMVAVIFLLIMVAIFVGLITFAINMIKKSNEEAKRAEFTYNQLIQGLPSDKQMLFMMQFNSIKKTPSTAVLLALFLGGLGVHKFYMGQTGLGILYLIFCWTYIPAIVGLIEAFTITGRVANYNQERAIEIAGFLH